MRSGRLTQSVVRMMDWIAARILPPDPTPAHQQTGRRGEEDAYFYLRQRGYVMIARNYRSPHYRGELDLVGWQRDVLCFIEVKTRTSRGVKPAHAAVDYAKQKDLTIMAREFLRHLGHRCNWRFDIVSVYYDEQHHPTFELFQNAFSVAYNH